MSLSLVITTYNRAEVLRMLLQGLTSQTDMDFQVVVAVDGSTDHTEAMLSTLRLPYEMKWVNTHCRGYGLAMARNLGILASDRPAVAILDDDSFPDAGYVAAHKHSVSKRIITGGPRNPADSSNMRMAWKMQELAKLPPLVPMSIPQLRQDWPNAYLIENNICMFRDDFIAIGLFSERLKMYGFIGQEFFGRAAFLGYRYQYNPVASVNHHGEIAGDNGFSQRRKTRDTQLANLLRPTAMTTRHYLAQVHWAQARAAGGAPELPAFWVRAALSMPWRLAKAVSSRAKRRLSRMLRMH